MTAVDEGKGGEMKPTSTWTTWEELLLACAVKRHGLKDWDSITMEIQTRTSSLYTSQICRDKYRELKRRFKEEPAEVDVDEDEDDEIPWIEDLRKLRVAELTQEVQRYDLSIQSLQSKVKRLEEERERSLNDNQGKVGEKPDLETDSKNNRSENDKIDDADGVPAEVSPVNSSGKEVSGEHSNRSFNESNSSENREEKSAGGGRKSEPVLTGDEDVKPDPDSKTIREDSCNDSSDTVAKQLVAIRTSKKNDSVELRGSEAAESKEGTATTKESSDVQSSASLTKKKRRKPGAEASRGGSTGGGVEEPVAVMEGVVVVKSEPLVALMDIIRTHKHGSVFGRRLESQKTEKYNKIVRKHVDLRVVQARIDDGTYSSCTNKFYLDLLLIFNNAIVFFPKSSPESIAAHALRGLVLKEMRKKPIDIKKPDPLSAPVPAPVRPKPEHERSDSLLAKQKSTAPIVVCRKRSSISGKPSSANKVAEKETVAKLLVIPKPPSKTSSNEEESSMKLKVKEKPVTGARSMRRSGGNSNRATISNSANAGVSKNQILSSSPNLGNSTSKGSDSHAAPSPPAKVEKKKPEVMTPTLKKRGAADFLKRIKKTSPGKGSVAETSKGSAEDGVGTRKGDQVKKKVVEERRDGTAARQRSGGGSGKQVKEDVSPSKRVGRPPKKGKEVVPAKRGRETVEPESKRPAKRTRR